MLDFHAFQQSLPARLTTWQAGLKKDKPPSEITELLEALWWEKKGHWDRAHKIV